MGPALIGQGLNFLAMLLPIIGQQTAQLAYLMLPLALATVLARTSILGYHSRYLTVAESTRSTATAVSWSSLLTVAASCGIVALLLQLPDSPTAGTVSALAGWTALLVITNGTYLMAVAVVTQEQRMDVYSTARLVFGVVNVAATVVVVWVMPFHAGLIVVAALNPLVGCLLILLRTDNRLLPQWWASRRSMADASHRRYFTDARRATGATFISECGFQIQGFLTPFLGPYQEIWAVVVRLTGGFGSLAQQVIAPSLEARIAAAIRDGDSAITAKWSRICALGGVVLGAGCAVVQTGALVFALPQDDAFTPLVLAVTAVFCVASLSTNLSVKIPLMKGLDKVFLAWSVVRLIPLVALLATTDGVLLGGIVVVQTVAAAVFLVVTLRPSRI